MELNTAVSLIHKGITGKSIQTWADLGAGRGLFTQALSQLLPAGSSIIAVDKDPKALVQIKVANNITLETKTLDFTSDALELQRTDGIVMANSLHYVRDQRAFLAKLLKITDIIVVVEYDTDKSNTWVPYPVSFSKLSSMNPGKTTRTGTAPSQYHKEGIYSATISPNLVR